MIDTASRRRRIFLSVLSSLLLLFAALPAASAAKPPIEWTQQAAELSVMEGMSATTQLQFSGTDLHNRDIKITGELATFAHADIGSAVMSDTSNGTIQLNVNHPAKAKRSYAGQVHFTENGHPVGKPLRVTITTVYANAETIPSSPSTATPERITSLEGVRLVSDQIIIALQDGAGDPALAIRAVASKFGAQIVGSVSTGGLYELRFPGIGSAELSVIREQLAAEPTVLTASYSLLLSPEMEPNDEVWQEPLRSEGATWNLEQINAPAAWDRSTGEGAVVGVIDTGFHTQHEDLDPNIIASGGSGGNNTSHGTHVAGTACAAGNNVLGITGVAWNCRLALQAVGDAPTMTQLVEAMNKVVMTNPRVVNISLGEGLGVDCLNPSTLTPAQVDLLEDIHATGQQFAEEAAKRPSILWVVAAGNDSTPVQCDAFGRLGQALDNVVSVAAVNAEAKLSTFSNFGAEVTLAAPGGSNLPGEKGIYSLVPAVFTTGSCELLGATSCTRSAYAVKAGTSMAAPHVTGTAALAFSAEPKLTPAEAKKCLMRGALAGNKQVETTGMYILNAEKTVDCATGNLPIPAENPGLTGVKAVASGYFTNYALKHDGSVWAWGDNSSGQLGDGTLHNSSLPVKVQGLSSVVSIAAAHGSAYAIKADGTVWTWGAGHYEVGFGPNILIPTQVPGLTDAASINVNEHPHILKKDGTVWSWGRNGGGQLGHGTNRGSDTPVQAIGLTGITQVLGSWGAVYALKDDGTVWAWGSPYWDGMNYGQLGLGGTASSNVPMQISELTDVASLDAALLAAYAVKKDGTVWSWGYNAHGELGNGSQSNSNVPLPVPGLTGISKVTAIGDGSVFALAKDGTVKGWGAYPTNYGTLGNGTKEGSLTPMAIPSLSAIKSIERGAANAFAVRSDGTVWAWGENSYSQLGTGTVSNALTPTQVGSLNNVVSLAVGQHSSLALTSDGSVWAWGFNNNGQLGDGTTTDSAFPVAIGR